MQVLVKEGVYKLDDLKHTGTCVVVEGEIKAAPEGASQKVELHATAIHHVGPCAPALPSLTWQKCAALASILASIRRREVVSE